LVIGWLLAHISVRGTPVVVRRRVWRRGTGDLKMRNEGGELRNERVAAVRDIRLVGLLCRMVITGLIPAVL
jgi:hypothetical protein